jgi:two-component system response regulator NreC
VLTMHDEDEYIVGSVRAGVSGYLLKDEAPSDLIAGIRALKDGKCYFAPSTFQALARVCRAQSPEPADPHKPSADGDGG